MTKKNICVFCGASSGSTPDYKILAEKVGKIIGENNFNLIYGHNHHQIDMIGHR